MDELTVYLLLMVFVFVFFSIIVGIAEAISRLQGIDWSSSSSEGKVSGGAGNRPGSSS